MTHARSSSMLCNCSFVQDCEDTTRHLRHGYFDSVRHRRLDPVHGCLQDSQCEYYSDTFLKLRLIVIAINLFSVKRVKRRVRVDDSIHQLHPDGVVLVLLLWQRGHRRGNFT